MSSLDAYFKAVDKAVKAGNATEHTHRPALKALLESLASNITATNEPQRIACGSPDFIVTRRAIPVGYVEAKDVGANLDATEETEQLRRYRASLRNLVLTDYLEFRLYRNGEHVHTAKLATLTKTGLRKSDSASADVERLLSAFLSSDVPTISNPRDLAERMATLARLIHDLIRRVFSTEGNKGDLHSQYDGFRKVLIADLTAEQFADMYAQTIAYGMFAARCNHTGSGFSREHAGKELPKTNPFLRKLFNSIAGPDLDDRIAWAVDDLAELLARADMAAILTDFGKATRQEDPVVHFYETFLAAYDPKMREARGVYYTPEPVVDYIVRSVDALLRRDFKLKDGLADSSQVRFQVPTPHGKKAFKEISTHRVQILDPACGTGTFLYAVIAHIREKFAGSKGMWPSYVGKHLLPRLYGFELLMAPYAVAHMKLGLELQETGYDFASEERLRVFLTNSLEEAHEQAGLPLFAQWLADEAAAASEIKRDVPIMVVMGNPPYSGHSVNKGPWIEQLMETYKKSPELKKPAQAKWLSDDYVKFIRFSQWRIEQTGYGILGFVTNHSYLDNPTFLDMRASLMATFDELYVLDLHGSTKKQSETPDGEKDENVFDIQQGVAICLFVKRTGGSGATTIYHGDLWGKRSSKYSWLASHDVLNTPWQRVQPRPPRRIFVPQDSDLGTEYEMGFSLADVLNQNGDPAPGILTTHDEFAISWTKEEAIEKVERLLDTNTEDEARSIWRLCKQDQWNYARAKQELATGEWRERVAPILYRPFDIRWTVYDRNVAVHRRERVFDHFDGGSNIAIVLSRVVEAGEGWQHVFATTTYTGHHAVSLKEVNYVLPLWLRPPLFRDDPSAKAPNISPDFLERFRKKLSAKTLDEESVFAYIYAILHAPSYRSRYMSYLRRDFPRIPITSNKPLFRELVNHGNRLLDIHLLRTPLPNVPAYPIAGDSEVKKVTYKSGRIYINDKQYFHTVADDVWSLRIGGYQIAEKWLKDRKDRLLSFDDLDHYRKVIAALRETLHVQSALDGVLVSWPLQ